VDICAFRWSGSTPEWTVGAKVHEGTGHRILSEFPAGWISEISGIGRGTKGSGVPPHPPENSSMKLDTDFDPGDCFSTPSFATAC
jgi:hypothetical protein